MPVAWVTHLTFSVMNSFFLAFVGPVREVFLRQSQGPSPGLKFPLQGREVSPQMGLLSNNNQL